MSFVGAGTCIVNANQNGNTAFNAAPQLVQSFNVGKGAQSLSFTSTAPTTAVVAGASYGVSATSTAGLVPVFSIGAAASSICSISGSSISFQSVGLCIVNANQAGNSNYNASAQISQSFSVGKGAQSISFQSVAPSNAQVAGATYTLLATSSAGIAVTRTSTTPLVCSVAVNVVSFLAAGTCERKESPCLPCFALIRCFQVP